MTTRFLFSILLIIFTSNSSFASETHFFEGQTTLYPLLSCLEKKGENQHSFDKPVTPNWFISKGFSGYGLLVGYGRAPIRNGPYEFGTLLFQLAYDIKPLLKKKFGLQPKGTVELIAEPMVSVITHPDNNAEIGISLLAKYGHKITSRLIFFVNGGAGAVYTSQHTVEQSTQGNFLTQIGVGFQYKLTKKSSLIAEYRFRHMSNGGIKYPNTGIDSNIMLIGISTAF